MHQYAVTSGREREDKEERLVGGAGGPEEELSLRASAGDEVRGAWKNLARSGHAGGEDTNRAAMNPADRLDSADDGWSGNRTSVRKPELSDWAPYMGIAPTFATIGKVTLDRYAALLKAGVRF